MRGRNANSPTLTDEDAVASADCMAALLRHSAFWASAMVSLVLVFNIAGSITAWLRPQRRLFWVPFCVVR